MFNTMTKGAKRRIRHKELAGREPIAITISVVILGVLVLICAGMLVPPLWTAVVESWRFGPGGQECSMLDDAAARQACYEELSARAARHPAKGANAPLIPRPSGQRSE
jgi:hypothetical protein